jgi:hypothetical protein
MKVSKVFNIYNFFAYVFKTVDNPSVINFITKSFPNHLKDILNGTIKNNINKKNKLTHLEILFYEHKDDINFIHEYIQKQIKLLQGNVKNDPKQSMLNNQTNIISHRLRDEYHSIVPYVRPPSKKALKEKSLKELLFPTKADSSPSKSVVKHPRLNHQALLLLDAFHQSYGDIGVSALLGQIPDFDIDDLEEAPSIQTVRNILADRHYTYNQLEQLINSTLDISEDDIAVSC